MSEDFKNYFIKDVELNSIEEDKLSAKDIAENVNIIIDNTKPPFSVAVTGKSGIGKSSIINLVKEKYEEDTENYNVQKINVWKNEELSIKEMLDSNFIQNVQIVSNENIKNKEQIKQETIDNMFDEKIKAQDDKEDKKEARKSILKTMWKCAKVGLIFLASLLITTLIFVFMEYTQNANIYNSNDVFFVENTYLNYRENFVLILVFALGLTALYYIVNTLIHANKKVSKDVVEKDYRNLNSVDNANGNTTTRIVSSVSVLDENKTNIIIIEDIDKLAVNKMLKTLEEIKHCNDYNNCIFIVPFDENVVKKAIAVRNEIKLSGNYKPLNFEKILDKIFQFKVYVPRFSNGDIKDYAVNLAQSSVSDFTEDYCSMDVFERVIRNVLIYKDVTTPRHAKKLINNFINNKILISLRAKNGKVDNSFVQSNNFDYQLAKISVIQTDFEDFYNILFKDFSYLDTLTKLYCLDIEELRNIYEGIDDDLKPFFTTKNKSLRNFLRQTKNIEIDNISTLMYLTKVKTEVVYKDKSLLSYIAGEEDLSTLRIQEVLELVKLIDNKDDLNQFVDNNFENLLENFKNNASNKIYYMTFNEIVNETYESIDEANYIKYLEIVADNYNYYPDEALEMFNNLKEEVPVSVMNILLERMEQTLTHDNYDKTFEFLRDNSDPFYDENGNVSDYVQFLVNYINLSSNPNEVITELDENFTRIGKVYELNKNIKGLDNLDYDKAYSFIAKSVDNGDLDRVVKVINKILSDEDSVESTIKIEEKMTNFNLVDVVECNVDDILDETFEGNKTLLKNLVEVASVKQKDIDPTDAMKIVEKALSYKDDENYIMDVYSVLNKFDRMYFYEIRRDFNEVIYGSFHSAKNDKIRKAALDCTRFFKNTRLFITKLTDEENKFYEKN